jgi:uncharacterized protein with HEPN domain
MDKDRNIIVHIMEHVENIFSTQKRFSNEYSAFCADKDYFNSVCMSLLQIGELSHHLTIEFCKLYPDIPWKKIIGLRNVVVHGYDQLDTETVWATVIDDIPVLYQNCKKITESSSAG